MNRPFKQLASLALASLMLLAGSRSARGQAASGAAISQVAFDQRLGLELPLHLSFCDHSGKEVRLEQLFGRRPVLLVPVYYRCPLLCNQLLNGLVRGLKPISAAAGTDFDVVAFSIDPAEATALAAAKRAAYLEAYGRPGSEAGWHFLTGGQASIEALCEAIGFRYTRNPATGLFTHASGIVVATTGGRIARYFYGIDFPPRELQAAIQRARAGRVSSPIARLLLLCYDYDSATGKYTLSILRLLRVSGTATAALVLGYLWLMFRREAKGRHAAIESAERGEQPGNLARS
jgi:protein SCO1/2